MNSPAAKSERSEIPSENQARRDWLRATGLFALTLVSTWYVGANMEHADGPQGIGQWLDGAPFALALMTILSAHELGHYFVGRKYGVDISPPYFIPMPIFIFGTMGAVIQIRERIKSRTALIDVGAAGPIAGFVFALPILIYGLYTSPVETLPNRAEVDYLLEGHSLLYNALLYAIKGPIPDGSDIMLTPVALAGWAGLLVTMINLIPVGQLDGGHIAYALFGERQNRVSRWTLFIMPAIGICVGIYYGVMTWFETQNQSLALSDLLRGVHWLVWAAILAWMTRDSTHPATDDEALPYSRKVLGSLCLLLFILLFMPSWLHVQ